MPTEPGFDALEWRRAHLDQIRENTSRLAIAQCPCTTHGWVEFKIPTAQYFTSTFIHRPMVSIGCSIDGDALVPTRFPRVSAGVYRWVQDVRGFYTGCWVYFTVDTKDIYIPTKILKDPGYDLIHDFQFTGIAIKALPSHLLEP